MNFILVMHTNGDISILNVDTCKYVYHRFYSPIDNLQDNLNEAYKELVKLNNMYKKSIKLNKKVILKIVKENKND